MTVLLDTTDLGEVETMLRADYSHVRLEQGADTAKARARVVRVQLGSAMVDEASFGSDVSYQMDPLRDVLVARVYSGGLSADQPGLEPAVFGAGRVTAIGALGGLPLHGGILHAHYLLITLDRRVFSEVAANRSAKEAVPVQLTSNTPVDPRANGLVLGVIDHIYDDLLSRPEAARDPLIAGAARRYLAATMLHTFPNTALLEPTIEDRRDTTPVLLRRAIAFIDDNAHLDITATDIARRIYVTPRALQVMFRKHLDCTPMDYLRKVRLQHAHSELVAGDQLQTTVARVARRWGFSHLGRFAVLYRQNYGQSPHVTLRK